MPKMELVYVSSNREKFGEIVAALPEARLQHELISIPEIISVDPRVVLQAKARVVYGQLGVPYIMDHSALYFGAYEFKLPGCVIDVMIEVLGLDKLCGSIQGDRRAISRTLLLYCDGKRFQTYEAQQGGRIAPAPVGDHGFGWDRIFIPGCSSETFGEMTFQEKRRWSSREMACRKFIDALGARDD